MKHTYMESIHLSGRYLINFANGGYRKLSLVRDNNYKGQYLFLKGEDVLLIHKTRKAVSYGKSGVIIRDVNNDIDLYIKRLMEKVSDEKQKKEIAKIIPLIKEHESYIFMMEVLVSCAVKNKDNFEYLTLLLPFIACTNIFNREKIEYLLLAILYGNSNVAFIIVESIINSERFSYFNELLKTEDYLKEIEEVLKEGNDLVEKASVIEEAVLSLKLKY